MRPAFSPLKWSLICASASCGSALMVSKWAADAAQRALQTYPQSDTHHIREIVGVVMGCAATLHFIALAFMVGYIVQLPRPKRSVPCIVVALPAAYLTYLAILVGLPGQTPAGGYITEKFLWAVLCGGSVGLLFLLWSLVALGPSYSEYKKSR
jgi:hypothetical protein